MNIDLYWAMDARSHSRFQDHLLERRNVSPRSVEYYDWSTSRNDMIVAWGQSGKALSEQYNGERDENQERL